MDGSVAMIAFFNKGTQLGDKRLFIGDTLPEAFPTEDAQLNLSHVQPASMFWSIMKYNIVHDFLCLLFTEGVNK